MRAKEHGLKHEKDGMWEHAPNALKGGRKDMNANEIIGASNITMRKAEGGLHESESGRAGRAKGEEGGGEPVTIEKAAAAKKMDKGSYSKELAGAYEGELGAGGGRKEKFGRKAGSYAQEDKKLGLKQGVRKGY